MNGMQYRCDRPQQHGPQVRVGRLHRWKAQGRDCVNKHRGEACDELNDSYKRKMRKSHYGLACNRVLLSSFGCSTVKHPILHLDELTRPILP